MKNALYDIFQPIRAPKWMPSKIPWNQKRTFDYGRFLAIHHDIILTTWRVVYSALKLLDRSKVRQTYLFSSEKSHYNYPSIPFCQFKYHCSGFTGELRVYHCVLKISFTEFLVRSFAIVWSSSSKVWTSIQCHLRFSWFEAFNPRNSSLISD